VKDRAETPEDCLGLALRDWRGERTQEQAVVLFGCGQPTYSRMEVGTVFVGVLDAVQAGVSVPDMLTRARYIARRDGVTWQ
jgi:hypothetical protein